MNGYTLPVSCPKCGGELEHVTSSVLAGTETSAIAACVPCRRVFQVLVHLRPVVKPASERAREAQQAQRRKAAVA